MINSDRPTTTSLHETELKTLYPPLFLYPSLCFSKSPTGAFSMSSKSTLKHNAEKKRNETKRIQSNKQDEAKRKKTGEDPCHALNSVPERPADGHTPKRAPVLPLSASVREIGRPSLRHSFARLPTPTTQKSAPRAALMPARSAIEKLN